MEADARARIYGILSRLFIREIDDGFAELLDGEAGRALLPGFFASAEAEALRDPAARAATLDADYAHLTVVDLCPYESMYRRDDAMVESGADNPVARFLRSYGFEGDLEAARAIGVDHLGIELELMAVLCSREAEAIADGGDRGAGVRRIERAFLDEHLLAWAPIYLLAARRSARTALYREAADAALEFLHADRQALAEAP